jgi:hypothetical protein
VTPEEGPLSTEERKLPFSMFDTHLHHDPGGQNVEASKENE